MAYLFDFLDKNLPQNMAAVADELYFVDPYDIKQLAALWRGLKKNDNVARTLEGTHYIKERVLFRILEKDDIEDITRVRFSYDPEVAKAISRAGGYGGTLTVFGPAHVGIVKNLPAPALSIMYCPNEAALSMITALNILEQNTPDYYIDLENNRLMKGHEWHRQNVYYYDYAGMLPCPRPEPAQARPDTALKTAALG